jgi:MSHA pilin protein MshC
MGSVPQVRVDGATGLPPVAAGRCARVRGFSLPELILVLVILGVLAVSVAPKLWNRQAIDAQGFFEESRAAVRYANKLAIGSGCDVQVSFGAGGYALRRRQSGCDATDCGGGCAFTGAVAHPSKPGGFAASAPPGVSVSSADFYFDKIGRPRDASDNLLTGDTDIVIGGTRVLRVAPQTGFAYAP